MQGGPLATVPAGPTRAVRVKCGAPWHDFLELQSNPLGAAEEVAVAKAATFTLLLLLLIIPLSSFCDSLFCFYSNNSITQKIPATLRLLSKAESNRAGFFVSDTPHKHCSCASPHTQGRSLLRPKSHAAFHNSTNTRQNTSAHRTTWNALRMSASRPWSFTSPAK